MTIKEMKELCKEHEELTKKKEIIEDAQKQRIWVKVLTAHHEEAFLSPREIRAIIVDIEKRIKEIESIIEKVMGCSNEI